MTQGIKKNIIFGSAIGMLMYGVILTTAGFIIDPAGAMNGMGYARMNASNLYNVDQIHHTNLGGYNFAQAIWSQLKNIPLFYTTVPT